MKIIYESDHGAQHRWPSKYNSNHPNLRKFILDFYQSKQTQKVEETVWKTITRCCNGTFEHSLALMNGATHDVGSTMFSPQLSSLILIFSLLGAWWGKRLFVCYLMPISHLKFFISRGYIKVGHLKSEVFKMTSFNPPSPPPHEKEKENKYWQCQASWLKYLTSLFMNPQNGQANIDYSPHKYPIFKALEKEESKLMIVWNS